MDVMHRECRFMLALRHAEERCTEGLLATRNDSHEPGCEGMWDRVSCWPHTALGQNVTLSCPDFIFFFINKQGAVTQSCTAQGWTEPEPPYGVACGYDNSSLTDVDKRLYYLAVKEVYTVGYSLSFALLSAAMLVLCLFRKLRCTRNYIHVQLFASYMLRASSVLVKDVVLFSNEDTDNCGSPTPWCKLAMVFFQYCIVVNFSWLLVEGLYLHTLLLVAFFPERTYFYCYIAFGWGAPALCALAWVASRLLLEDTGCWDTNGSTLPWWIIKGPILLSILVNFSLFVSIIHMLLKKLRSPLVRGARSNHHYKRLAKSTLLLIPLFGVHYAVFAFFPDEAGELATRTRLYLELALGSFQGFVVALLYCFLNGEVQLELRRKWRGWRSERLLVQSSKQRQQQQQQHAAASGGGSTRVSLLLRGSAAGTQLTCSQQEQTTVL
ncbi:vasoactive intestinal polypeptide receptor 2-like isoform X2 [Petromyzon marinus]|uniref:vasoactive intestinal polypeptide receptor 2-like isoform X2 n=1 Tax=Petromyzon marinus TaxID=7757 RepID=UPI003F70C290